MNALTVGALILLYLILQNVVAAYIETQVIPETDLGECQNINLSGQNTTECQAESGPSFVDTLLEVSVSGVNGAPDWFNDFWLLLNIFLLSLGLANILAFFVGLFFGGSG